MTKVLKLGMVVHPVGNLSEAVSFYRDALGLEVKFRDGDRFCALDVGGTTLALAAREEALTAGPAVSLKVEDVDRAVEALVAAGARVLRPAEAGPHERRAVLRDPDGNSMVIYGPLTSAVDA